MLHFNYKDIFRAFRYGFSAKKLWVIILTLFGSLIVYNIFTYIALIIGGDSFSGIWQYFRLFPTIETSISPWYVNIIWYVGIILAALTYWIGITTITKITIEQLKGDEFYEIKEAFKFSMKFLGAMIASPLLMIIFIGLLVGSGLVLALIGKIPYFGPIVIGLMSIPAFAVSLFIVYLLIILFFTFILTPIIVGVTKSDAFDTLFEVFSCVDDQPWRLITYQSILAVMSVVGIILLGYFTTKAITIGTGILKILMGAGIEKILASSTYFIKLPELPFINGFFNIPQVGILSGNWAEIIAAVLLAITYYGIIFFVIGYGITIWTTGNTLAYIIIVKKKDDRNLLETEDDFEVPEKIDNSTEEKEKEEKKTEDDISSESKEDKK